MSTEQKSPAVSVVMSVFDRADLAKTTIDSVLGQKQVELEFIIVSDGATPPVLDIIAELEDDRVKLIQQPNGGQTSALIKGCHAAKHEYIARIDAGDIMLPSRLQLQSQHLLDNPKVGMVSCWVKMLTTEGYYLYDVCHSTKDLRQGLAAVQEHEFKSPLHTSMMFRKSVYEQAGGYRAEFYFTQDCDLWTRMLQYADIASVDAFLTHAIFSVSGISGKYADFQKQLVRLVVKGNSLRENGSNDQEILQQAKDLRPNGDEISTANAQRFQALYFIASVLSSSKSPHASQYWRRALDAKPFSLVSRVRWLLSLTYSNSVNQVEKR